MDPPAETLTFNNMSNDGTSKDEFIIYGYNGKKDFSMTSPFVKKTKFIPGDKDCAIRYKLVHKGTDTDVVAEGLYPFSLVEATDTGYVRLRIDYTDKTYRPEYEQKDPEFDIVATG